MNRLIDATVHRETVKRNIGLAELEYEEEDIYS